MAVLLVAANEPNQQVQLVSNFLPGDTNAHSPATDGGFIGFADLRMWAGCQIWIISTLNQIVDIQVGGSWTRTAAAGQTDLKLMNGSLMVPAYSSGNPLTYSVHVGPGASAWAPWVYPVITAETTPTTGALSLVAYKFGYSCVPTNLLGP